MSRIRKAWSLTSWHWNDAATVYAQTGSKALYRLYVEADSSATFAEFLKRVRVRRDAGSKDMISYRLTDLGRNVARGEAETYPAF